MSDDGKKPCKITFYPQFSGLLRCAIGGKVVCGCVRMVMRLDGGGIFC